MKRTALLLLALAVLPSMEDGVAQEFQIVVNASNDLSSVSKDDLSRIFLKKTASWPSGTPAVPVDLSGSDPAREAFCQAILGRGADAVAAYWQQQIFSGREVPPEQKDSPAAVLAFIATKPGAVGYVPVGTDLGEGVKAIVVG